MDHELKTPEDVTEFESQMAKNAKVLPLKDKLKLDKAAKEKKENFISLPMAVQYENAWKQIYSKLPGWRKKEIDNQLKTGTLSDKDWDNDFVQLVTALAEKDDPQAV